MFITELPAGRCQERFEEREVPMNESSTGDQWIVIVSPGSSWAKCYGPFNSYDESIDWLRANQFTPSECGVHPVYAPPSQDAQTQARA